MKTLIDLLIIDPQKSFCDPTGELYVKGAEDDMKRLAAFISANKDKIRNILVSLDSHHYIHIAHPVWWHDKDGNSPKPYTLIQHTDVSGDNPAWKTREPIFARQSIEYVQRLEEAGKTLCIWPPHCLIGSVGHAIQQDLFLALTDWEQTNFNIVDKIVKGSNMYTEQYSIFKAEIPDKHDPDTDLNIELIEKLRKPAMILVAGEALSHCIAESIRHAVEHIKPNKFVLLTDTMSSVPTFEKQGENFLIEMRARGMNFSTTAEFRFEE
jgi:nicotinamidase-related amidase